MVVDRGAHEEIDVFPGFPLDNKLSGNVVDLCPVGALGRQGLPLPAARLVHEEARRRLRRLLDRLLDLTSKRIRTASIGSSRARIRTSTSGGCATKGATAFTTCTATARLTDAAAPRRRRTVDCSSGPTLPGELDERLREAGRVGGRALAASDGRRSLPAGQVRPRDRSASARWCWARCRWWARTRRSRTASRFAPRSAPIAAASKRSSGTSPAAWLTFDELLGGLDDGARSAAVWVSGGYKTRLDRRGDGRAVRRPSTCWSCRTCSPRRCRSGPTYRLAGRGVRRAGRLVRQSRRPAADRSTGPFARRRACASKGSCTGSCWRRPGSYDARARAGRSGPRDSVTSPPRPTCRSARWASNSKAGQRRTATAAEAK